MAYVYTPLAARERVIRLMRLKAGRFTEELRCEMFEASFGNQFNGIPFEALSYVWGCTKRQLPILVDGQRLRITRNLDTALRYLRYQKEDRILWIDAICIDQESNYERIHQFRLMSEIYTEAEQVLVWLGLPTEQTDLVMDLAKMIQYSSNFTESRWRYEVDFWSDFWFSIGWGNTLVQCRSWSREDAQSGLRDLLTREWFERVWILQEIANASAACIMCGTRSVLAKTFALIPSIFGVEPPGQSRAVLDIMPPPGSQRSRAKKKRDLSVLLRQFRTCKASEPRDRIYALYGISDIPKAMIEQVDYRKPIKAVITDTICFLLNDETLPREDISPKWKMDQFLARVDSLSTAVLVSILNEPSATWPLETVKKLLSRDDCDPSQCPMNGDPITIRALKNADEVLIGLLLEQSHRKAKSAACSWQSLLATAVVKDYHEAVRTLLGLPQVDPNVEEATGTLPLFAAAWGGCYNSAKCLLSWTSIDVNRKSTYLQKTALCAAVERGHVEVATLLLRHSGIDVNATDIQKRTALHLAAENGHDRMVGLLLKQVGICVDALDTGHRTPLWLATKFARDSIARRAREKKTALSHSKQASNTMTIISSLLDSRNVDVNVRDYYLQETPLINASWNGDLQMTEWLFSRPELDLNLSNRVGVTPLFAACSSGKVKLIKFLIDKRAWYNAGDADYSKLLSFAAFKGWGSVVKVILNQDPSHDVNTRGEFNRTPIWHAAANGDAEMVRLLLARGARIDIVDTTGQTPIRVALRKQHWEVTNLLVDHQRANPSLTVSSLTRNWTGIGRILQADERPDVERTAALSTGMSITSRLPSALLRSSNEDSKPREVVHRWIPKANPVASEALGMQSFGSEEVAV